MLSPNSRAVLLEQLRPPSGCMFDEAVATTFTLDLSATLIPALAFSSFSYSGSAPDPIAVLESLRRATGRFDVFCQAGNIAVPQQAADLMAFLEPVVHEVRRPRGGLFHPKVWFVRYVDDDGSRATDCSCSRATWRTATLGTSRCASTPRTSPGARRPTTDHCPSFLAAFRAARCATSPLSAANG